MPSPSSSSSSSEHHVPSSPSLLTPTSLPSHGSSPHQHHHDPVHEGRDYIYGAVASLVNIGLTFPVNKVMFRQQLHGMRFFKAVHQIKMEGMGTLFRGLLPPLVQRTLTVSLMFGTYTNYKGALHDCFPALPLAAVHIIAAMGAGTTEAIFAPFERVQVILQDSAYHHRLHNTFHAFGVVSRYGIREIYRGTSAILLRNGPSNAVYLGLREPLMQYFPKPASEFGQTLNAFICGACLGAFLSTCFFPLNVVKNRMQTRLGEPYLGIRDTFRIIFEERGHRWRKMFRGVHVNYTRSFLSWGIINATYEFLKRHFG